MKTLIPLIALAALAWDVPSPQKASHPAVKEAPASDPRTYTDETAFQKRVQLIVAGLKDENLQKWRTGYFASGDPGKFLPGAAMAKLLTDPKAADAIQYMNDDRSYKEHYHFAVVNWARFLPLFGDVLTADTKKKLAAANVMPSYVEGGRFSGLSTDQALAKAKETLRKYVKGLYAAGQGEWDSSTYLMFDLHGMLNIYDFAKDDETRLLAKAALDWYVAGYALKYRDGVYTAPNQRGFAGASASNISDKTGWLWWGLPGGHELPKADGFRYAIHPATSSWRPNKVLCNIAQKKLAPLPAEQRNTKPNYWFGGGLEPKAGQYHETVYLAPQFTIGTLWTGHGSQMTRFMIAVQSDKGAIIFTGGNPRCSDHTGKKTGIGFADGNGRYTQFAAMGPTVMSLSQVPADDAEAAFSFFSLPEGVTPKEVAGWQTLAIGDVTVALYPLGGKAEVAETAPDKKGKYLKIPGAKTGFVVHVGNDFAKLKVTDNSVTDATGKVLTMKFNPATADDAHGNRVADVTIDGQPVDVSKWPLYSGPFVTQQPGILTVSDGKDGYSVDFTGDLPVYKTK